MVQNMASRRFSCLQHGRLQASGEKVCFGFDDFDDSLVADYQYDIWRFSTSIVLDCWERHLYDAETISTALDTFSSSYLKSFKKTVKAEKLFAATFTSNNTCKPLAEFLKKTEKKSSRRKMLEKWTIGSENRLFSPNSSKVKRLSPQRSEQLRDALNSYRKHRDESAGLELSESRMQILDVVERIGAGTGSWAINAFMP